MGHLLLPLHNSHFPISFHSRWCSLENEEIYYFFFPFIKKLICYFSSSFTHSSILSGAKSTYTLFIFYNFTRGLIFVFCFFHFYLFFPLLLASSLNFSLDVVFCVWCAMVLVQDFTLCLLHFIDYSIEAKLFTGSMEISGFFHSLAHYTSFNAYFGGLCVRYEGRNIWEREKIEKIHFVKSVFESNPITASYTSYLPASCWWEFYMCPETKRSKK
jgi:hypothetical protein